MDFAKASYNFIYGDVKAEWKKVSPNNYEYKIVVPANCEAQVVLPGRTVKVKAGAHTFTIK